jgi:hypothetical protein
MVSSTSRDSYVCHHVLTGFRIQAALQSMGREDCFIKHKPIRVCKFYRSPQFSVEFNNTWIYTCTSPYTFKISCLIRHRKYSFSFLQSKRKVVQVYKIRSTESWKITFDPHIKHAKKPTVWVKVVHKNQIQSFLKMLLSYRNTLK